MKYFSYAVFVGIPVTVFAHNDYLFKKIAAGDQQFMVDITVFSAMFNVRKGNENA
jgi:hypothetical protein